MSSFRQQVNTNIPLKKTEIELANELKSDILKDVEKVANSIRWHILEKAKKHTSSDQYIYRGVLSSSIFTESSQFSDVSLFLTKKEEKKLYISEYSNFFIDKLRNILSSDEIYISDLMYGVCNHGDMDYNLPSTYFSKFNYQISDENEGRGYDFKFISKPQNFIEPIKVIRKYKLQHSMSSSVDYTTSYYYKGKMICEVPMINAKAYLWIGIQIRYKI